MPSKLHALAVAMLPPGLRVHARFRRRTPPPEQTRMMLAVSCRLCGAGCCTMHDIADAVAATICDLPAFHPVALSGGGHVAPLLPPTERAPSSRPSATSPYVWCRKKAHLHNAVSDMPIGTVMNGCTCAAAGGQHGAAPGGCRGARLGGAGAAACRGCGLRPQPGVLLAERGAHLPPRAIIAPPQPEQSFPTALQSLLTQVYVHARVENGGALHSRCCRPACQLHRGVTDCGVMLSHGTHGHL
jgi:hypothetical protein